ncbi:MAG: hypothetical protein LBL81_00910 [Tannerella sp.]|jgi:hypothetical protein|nr:hypothetical protein [Tannerella sp.]
MEEENEDILERFRHAFDVEGGQFHVVEYSVPIDVQMEYFKYSEQMRKNNIHVADNEYEESRANLWDATLSPTRRKHILSALALTNNVKAYRLLEAYVKQAEPDPEIVEWAQMALMESRIMMESELLEEKQIYISTGLGGKGDKLRFFVLLLANGGQVFKDYQKQIVEREFNYALSKQNSEIERIAMHDLYIEMVLLIPMRYDIKSILSNVISECNQYGEFIADEVTITNVKELSETEIDEVLKHYHESSKHTQASR